MLALGVGEDFSVAVLNAGILALWAVLPGLLFGFTRQLLVARRIRPEFSLRKSEVLELDRAVPLYQRACYRLQELSDQSAGAGGLWSDLLGRRADIWRRHVDELEDLYAHAHHLRATITRLKRRPLERLRSWVHIVSSQFALGGAIAAHIVGLALLIFLFHVIWMDELTSRETNPLVWYPLDARLFYANAIAAGFAAVVAPVFYVVRWASLRQEYWVELCALKAFANTDPLQIIAQPQAEQPDQQQADSSVLGGDNSWFGVLGLSHSATIDEVKEAYKALIKQNHPDRVHGMSPAFGKLAEAETKKLNAAYQLALFSVPPLENGRGTAPK